MSDVEIRFVTEDTEAGVVMPDKLYTPEETAVLLRLERVNSVHEIPELMLTPTRVGPKGGRKLYRGRDVLRYYDLCRSIPMEDAA